MPFTPARYKKPETGIRASTRSFTAPRVFCKRRPSFKKVPWTRHIEVRAAKATSRVLSHVGSISKEWSRSRTPINSQTRIKRLRCVHSLKTTLFGVVVFPCQRWMNIAVKSAYTHTACHQESISSKNTRRHEFRTTVNIFEVILRLSTPRKSLDRKYKQGPNVRFRKKSKTNRPEFNIYHCSTGCNESTDKPHDQGHPDASRRPENVARCSIYSVPETICSYILPIS